MVRLPCRIASLALAAVLAIVVGADAAEFNGPTSTVDLPGFRPDEVKNPVVVAKSVGADPSAVKLFLLNPDAPMKGVLESYEVISDPATKGWRVEGVTKTKQRKPIGTLSLEGDSLTFLWAPGVTRADGGQLRNCVLGVVGSNEQAVGLRAPLQQPSLVLDFTREINRIPLVDDLPDEAHLTLAVAGIAGAAVSGELSAPTVKVKEAAFVGIKRADADVPGARMDVILWKTSLKPEVIVRPELVPVTAQGGSSIPTTGFSSSIPRPPVTVNVADGSDPTKPNSVNLPFTIRSLATAKSAIGKQLLGAQNQVVIDRNLIFSKQRELARYQGAIVGTQEEIDLIIAKINRLQAEITALNNEIRQLEQVVVPALQKQIAAFPPLETLGNSLHQKASLGLRVYYTVAGKPVDVLVMSGAATSTDKK